MEGDAATAMDVLLAPGTAAAPPLRSAPEPPQDDEATQTRMDLGDLITSFKQAADPETEVEQFIQMVRLAKRLG